MSVWAERCTGTSPAARWRFSASQATSKAECSLLPKARQSLEVTQKAYSAEKADFMDLVDAQETLLHFRLSRERSLADRAITLAKIEEITGRELPHAEENKADTGGAEEPVDQGGDGQAALPAE